MCHPSCQTKLPNCECSPSAFTCRPAAVFLLSAPEMTIWSHTGTSQYMQKDFANNFHLFFRYTPGRAQFMCIPLICVFFFLSPPIRLCHIECRRLEQNFITEITPKAFANFKRLRRIDLSNNNISRVAHDAFAGLKSLTTL